METEQITVIVINADEVVDVLDELRQIPDISLAIAAKQDRRLNNR